MIATSTDLTDQLASLVKGAAEFEQEHGSVECIVGPNSPIAQHKVERVAGYDIQVSEVTLVDTTNSGKPDVVIDGELVYFVEHSHPMFGRNAEGEDDWWDE